MAGEIPVFILKQKTTQVVAIKNSKQKFNMSAVQTKSIVLAERPEWLQVVQQQVTSLRFGVVQIVIHDSQVKQIEKTERVRLDKPSSPSL
jgi:hypothetical protein